MFVVQLGSKFDVCDIFFLLELRETQLPVVLVLFKSRRGCGNKISSFSAPFEISVTRLNVKNSYKCTRLLYEKPLISICVFMELMSFLDT